MAPTLKQDLLKETFLHDGKPYIFSDTLFEKIRQNKEAGDKDLLRSNLLREVQRFKDKTISVDNKTAIPLKIAIGYIFRHCDDFNFCSKIAQAIETKLYKGNESNENSILNIYKDVADQPFKDNLFENIYQYEALSHVSSVYECHKEDFTESQWKKILFFEHHFSLTYPDGPYELHEEITKRQNFLEYLQIALKYASITMRESEKAFSRRRLRKTATDVENSVEIIAGSIHLPSVIEGQMYRYMTEKHPNKIQTVAVADIDSSKTLNCVQVYVEIDESVNALETTLFQQVAEDISTFLCNKHALNAHTVLFFDKGAFSPYLVQSNVARFTLRDDILTRKVVDKTVFSWRPQASLSQNEPTASHIIEKCEACYIEDLPAPLDIARFDCVTEWLLDVPLSIQIFMEAFLNKDSFKRAVNAKQLLQSKLEKLYLTYDILLNTYNKKYFGLLQEANTKELVMNFQNVSTVFSITSESGITMSLPAAEKKMKTIAVDDLRYYNTFLKRHPFTYNTQKGEAECLVSLRQCHLILMMDNLVRLKTREDSIRCRGDSRTHQLCTLPITIQGIPKDCAEVKKWHDSNICDGSTKCQCKEKVKLPGETVKQVLIDLNEKEGEAMGLFQSLCTWGHPQIWKTIENSKYR